MSMIKYKIRFLFLKYLDLINLLKTNIFTYKQKVFVKKIFMLNDIIDVVFFCENGKKN